MGGAGFEGAAGAGPRLSPLVVLVLEMAGLADEAAIALCWLDDPCWVEVLTLLEMEAAAGRWAMLFVRDELAGVVKLVDRLIMSLPCTTRLSVDFFRSRVIISVTRQLARQHGRYAVYHLLTCRNR